MSIDKNIFHKFVSLASIRVFCINRMIEICYANKKESEALFEKLTSFLDGIATFSDSLGLKIDSIMAIKGLLPLNKLDKIIKSTMETIGEKDEISKIIEDTYGVQAQLAFSVAQDLFVAHNFCFILTKVNLKKVPKHRKPLIREEIQWAAAFIKEIAVCLIKDKTFIKNIFGPEIADKIFEVVSLMNSSSPTKKLYARIHYKLNILVDLLMPGYTEIMERLVRSKELEKQLNQCKPGQKNWRKYEDLCIKILRYLFIPPFKGVRIEARSEGNNERRDAILPNNQYLGFWQLIRDEFSSRHIVCEFKNSGSKGRKDWLNQLRIYLEKPTIGKFGLLFIRKTPSKSLIQAQRDAYEQRKILILVIDDEKMTKLLKARAFLSSVDDFLENEKIDFEIKY